MVDSYRKKLVDRFWEERRLTHPHLSLLYDVVKQLIDRAHITDARRAQLIERLQELSWIEIHGKKYHIYEVDAFYQRNITQHLSAPIQTNDHEFSVGQLDMAFKFTVSDLSDLASEVAQIYYMDIALNDPFKEEEAMEDI